MSNLERAAQPAHPADTFRSLRVRLKRKPLGGVGAEKRLWK